jgi:hypothetical protein
MQDKGISALGFKLKFSLTAKHKMFAYLHSVGNMCEGELVIPTVLPTYRQSELARIVMLVIIFGMCSVRILAGKSTVVIKVVHEYDNHVTSLSTIYLRANTTHVFIFTRFYCKLCYSLVATCNLVCCIRLHLMMAHRSRNML